MQGVGYITALTFVLTLGNKERFRRSRDVGCYLGLRPRCSQSGERDPQLSITKAGNIYHRSFLIECANHILRPHGRDSALLLRSRLRTGYVPVATTPCSDDCEPTLVFKTGREMAASTLLSDLNRHRACTMKSSSRVRIETRWRATCLATEPTTKAKFQ